MAGKGGKLSHRTGNPKYNNSDTINIMTEVSQTSNIHPDEPRDPNGMNPGAVVNFELNTSESSYTVDQLEHLLYLNLDLLYIEAHDQLLKSGCSKEEVESAILLAGSVRGKMDFLSNVCQNTIAYIEKKAELRTEASKDPVGLYACALETMVDFVAETRRKQI